jgi:Asp-tRNA(Asn)/Glu-tRNA(Gln) amidotransferase A subunit family amidase
LVQILKDAGAIPFVKTNVMQSLLGYESSNPVWGRVSNPWDTKRSCKYLKSSIITQTAGGSSGGEAALISSYGSPLGFG